MTYRKGLETLEEETTIDSLPVDGEIPNWLDGTLLRIGPAEFEVGEDSYNHWFDGHGMLHAFKVSDGQVSYTNRFVESESRASAERDGEIVRPQFATDPCMSIFSRVMQLFTGRKGTDNTNVNVARMADRFVAMTETPLPIAFNPESLESEGHVEYDDDLEGAITSAHPQPDTERNTIYNYVTDFGRTATYRLYSQPEQTLRRELLTEIEVDAARYMHSFGMTENYLILTEFPLILHPLRLILTTHPLAECMTWEPDRGTRFRVIDKRTGELVGSETTEACFAFHHVNAWEEDSGELVVDLAAYPDASIIEDLYLDQLRSDETSTLAGRLRRYRLQADGSGLRSRRISSEPLELPRINETRRAESYRHVWATGQSESAPFLDKIVRIDTENGESVEWKESNCFPGEPVFVPRSESQSETDGVLLTVVLDGDAGCSYLLVLEADSLDEIGRARLPHHIPFDLHGAFY